MYLAGILDELGGALGVPGCSFLELAHRTSLTSRMVIWPLLKWTMLAADDSYFLTIALIDDLRVVVAVAMHTAALCEKLVLVFAASCLHYFISTLRTAVTLYKIMCCGLKIAMYATGDDYLCLTGSIDGLFIGVAVAINFLCLANKLFSSIWQIVGAVGAAMTLDMQLRLLLEHLTAFLADNLHRCRAVLVFRHQRVVVFVTVLIMGEMQELFKRVPPAGTQQFQSALRTALLHLVMIDGALLERTVLGTDNRHRVIAGLEYGLRIVVLVTMHGS